MPGMINIVLRIRIFKSCLKTIIFFISIHCSIPASAQLPGYQIRFFDEAIGIRTGNFQRFDITKDTDNFLWVLQTSTLQRFDGKQVDDFTFNENPVSIICDAFGTIWITTDIKVYRFVKSIKKFVPVPIEGNKQVTMGKLFQINNKVWIQTTSGFFEFNNMENVFKKALSDVPQTKKIVRRNFAYFKNVLFFENGDTLYKYNLASKEIKWFRKKAGVDIFPLSENLVLTTSWQYVSEWYDFKKNEHTPAIYPREFQSSSQIRFNVRDVKQLDDNRFIIASRQGIFEYRLEENKFKKLNFYQSGKLITNDVTVTRIYIDAEKKTWLIFPDGIAHYDHLRESIALMRNNDQDKLKTWTNIVLNFAEDNKGNVWFANSNGFSCWNFELNTITSFPHTEGATNRLSHPTVRGLVYDGKYLILGPSDKGLWLFDPLEKTYRRPTYPPGNEGKKVKDSSEYDFVDQIRTLHNGNHLIAGRDALYILDGKTYQLNFFNCPAGKENSNFIHQDVNKNIWIGTNKGLHCLDSNMQYLFKVKAPLGNLRAFCVWNKNEILVSGQGIFSVKFINDSIHTEVFNQFFKDKSVNLIYKDNIGKLWIGTTQGLYRVDSATKKIEFFDYADNVQGNGFNNDAVFRSSRNILFLGGVNGINYFIPEKIPAVNHFLKVSIQKIRINQDDSSYTTASAPFSLQPDQRSVEISFAAPYYYNANKVKYRYMLEGYEKEWKSTVNNSVLFTSLPSRNYLFRVGASIDGLHWYESNEAIPFSIRLPFWKTWWFILLISVLAGIIIFAFYRYELNKRLEVERIRLGISRDLHDDIGSTLSSINILAKSSLPDNFIEVNDNHTLLLQKIQQRSQRTLDAMDDLIWNTRPENDSLESLTVRMREYAGEVLEAAGIEFALHSPLTIKTVKLSMTQKKNVYLIFKEAINNLAKYSKSKKAFIDFDYQKNALHMNIRDEGIGFITTNGGKGNGLQNMKARAVEMNADLEIISNASGTAIRLELPV